MKVSRAHDMKRTCVTLTILLGLMVLARSEPVKPLGPKGEQSTNSSLGDREPIKPIPRELKLDARKVALGKKLFFEPKLSKDNTISCASCHDLHKGGTDQRFRSLGIDGAEGGINAPTVFNSGFNFKQFWDGRAHSLEDQVDGPIQAAAEMGSKWEDIVSKLRGSPDYVAA